MFDPRNPTTHFWLRSCERFVLRTSLAAPRRKARRRPAKGSPSHCERLAFAAMEVHAGPYFFDKGTLTKKDKDEIFRATKVVANIRSRKQWQWKRGLTLSGPMTGMEEAKRMAEERIQASLDAPIEEDEENIA